MWAIEDPEVDLGIRKVRSSNLPLQQQGMLRSVPSPCCACTSPLQCRMRLVEAKPGATPSSPALTTLCAGKTVHLHQRAEVLQVV